MERATEGSVNKFSSIRHRVHGTATENRLGMNIRRKVSKTRRLAEAMLRFKLALCNAGNARESYTSTSRATMNSRKTRSQA